MKFLLSIMLLFITSARAQELPAGRFSFAASNVIDMDTLLELPAFTSTKEILEFCNLDFPENASVLTLYSNTKSEIKCKVQALENRWQQTGLDQKDFQELKDALKNYLYTTYDLYVSLYKLKIKQTDFSTYNSYIVALHMLAGNYIRNVVLWSLLLQAYGEEPY